MPKFIVTQRSFINNALQEPGAEVEYDPGKGCEVADNLEPVKSSSKAADTGAGKED
ncbi:hypothetical protein [Asticcacaulis solisilvae]|uniref:hypothetical protein n=1 Tax=Asticcacaulis solisilvae TaxID=1217274 RepID=UPI003FD7F946